MRRIIICLAALAAGLTLAWGGVAAASPQHHRPLPAVHGTQAPSPATGGPCTNAHPARTDCTPLTRAQRRADPCASDGFRWAANVGWRWEATLTSDPSGLCDIRASLKCHSRLGNAYWFHGGWVHPEGKESGVNCGGAYTIPWQGNVDQSPNGGTTYYYWVEYYWPCPPACVKGGLLS